MGATLEELEKRAAEDEKQEKMELEKQFNVRERLMRRSKKTFNIEFEDDLGKFNVKCRLLTEKEQRVFIKLSNEVNTIVDLEKYDALMNQVYELLAYPNICQEKSLSLKYWKDGEFSNDLPWILLSKAAQKTRELLTEAVTFR